ncbi:uncharacterized protein LOC119689301 [Teleopsis dalmanni]|uniref:uncharacterized protein LOC119689301 n=1 Tax=Teleopsis dalmanni TaxID=139649 RepID=UPI0018CE64F3|nr:uncharacterized protein LOC119689301 [Teleopsis dalmanni]
MNAKDRKKKKVKAPLVSKKRAKYDDRKIPKQKFERAFKLLQESNNEFWNDENDACAVGIHRVSETEALISTGAESSKLKHARTCLLRRDWRNLAKVLTITNPTGDQTNTYLYPLCIKYGFICLAHGNTDVLRSYSKVLLGNENIEDILERCTQIENNKPNMKEDDLDDTALTTDSIND